MKAPVHSKSEAKVFISILSVKTFTYVRYVTYKATFILLTKMREEMFLWNTYPLSDLLTIFSNLLGNHVSLLCVGVRLGRRDRSRQ